ncbi:hypothetical protein COW36_09855 [bacterium (Candidatus Blackallbacteria) CG17_big_fil_post_rev_8_21_14_2_50_48_46]|uniref:Uncharacterized protein n=1 Tax=bacterium (Candidatus Blackallbacteria) CG17_big_fil_post_rev_8_21_14_2_50_48_46 TaxID=2014261 RepID=A0A2M7G5D1_9BACT|nr:MAG: hypothetical protein COW64_25985 [bacterium (Candidatus Blackallbacteria) CG18_big_fil_WC_8_21_14_2_50_49_26]PIW17151.1 MAG: hypothetical protein COW36_09855 [bacterium (Candidatus Blackallbacteria) CG17_big_fil_post_rev_8_21_14_2_50_48_46]PIW49997.1 MAG: hypothetical protein COW20_04015 [bacterium (Candidatus Blackallbacteria) CG13_big_fil_rev_8_21_14_2_50_49_14]
MHSEPTENSEPTEEEIVRQLYSDQAREIKVALDYLEHHTELARAHLERLTLLKDYGAHHAGLGAVQVEVAAIVLWNHLNAGRNQARR